jgi:hypothetical protein
MKRATVRVAQAVLALALLLSAPYMASAQTADDEASARPLQLLSVQAQPDQQAPSPWIYGYFRDPLWPGPGQRFIAADCPIGLGLTIIHYCPSTPPLDEMNIPTVPPLPPTVLQCSPWYQYFPTCRRPMLPW